MSWVDVVAVVKLAFRRAVESSRRARSVTGRAAASLEAENAMAAVNAIAELIAAVDERRAACDEATRLTEWMYTLQPAPSDFTREARQAAIERFNAAIVRETAALAACKPARGAE